MKKTISLILLSSTLAACANPTVVKPVNSEDYKLSCEQLKQEIDSADFAVKHARDDDRFRLSYMLIAPAAVSYYRISDAEEAAKKRLNALQDISDRKACNGFMPQGGIGGESSQIPSHEMIMNAAPAQPQAMPAPTMQQPYAQQPYPQQPYPQQPYPQQQRFYAPQPTAPNPYIGTPVIAPPVR